jgi:hypothetical protein
MGFRGTPLDMTTLLVVALAIIAVTALIRKKYDSNLPLFFYFVALVFTNFSDQPIEPGLLYAGLIFCLLLRFEFMGGGFAKMIAFMATSSMCLVIWVFLADVFGQELLPF